MDKDELRAQAFLDEHPIAQLGAVTKLIRAIRSEHAADPWVRLGVWLADRERGPHRRWHWYPAFDANHPTTFWAELHENGERIREGRPSLESALHAALDKAGAK
jgi:hypothetical protein